MARDVERSCVLVAVTGVPGNSGPRRPLRGGHILDLVDRWAWDWDLNLDRLGDDRVYIPLHLRRVRVRVEPTEVRVRPLCRRLRSASARTCIGNGFTGPVCPLVAAEWTGPYLCSRARGRVRYVKWTGERPNKTLSTNSCTAGVHDGRPGDQVQAGDFTTLPTCAVEIENVAATRRTCTSRWRRARTSI